ncbi:axonemal dynein light intermediate polypeptide 1-like [Paramacrobiotus metropolitanus]|uniref:axonemal dynein light intermediate polypeptide 1-like n=1 Tax=Paramacrobiotus metropolitanus TaxID=2943436 RepID=UPI0024461F72|nr:axonemal dynein light intermediate polypeptide 1-like [Paramacrobiotus metropolitanus]
MDSNSLLKSPVPPEHLVKHDAPEVLIEKPNVARAGLKHGKTAPAPDEPVDELGYFLPVLPKLERRDNYKTNIAAVEPILDLILPPREWVDNGYQYTQKISRVPASRMDVINLQEKLDARLEHLQARDSGICPIRRDLYSQTFDELIREITLESPERGLMFLRIRDEIRMTMAAYETLFERGVAYGVRNALMFEEGKGDTEEQVKDLEESDIELERQINEWKLKCEFLERKNAELLELDDRKHHELLKCEKRPGIWLKQILDAVMNHSRGADFMAGAPAVDIKTEPNTTLLSSEKHAEADKP